MKLNITAEQASSQIEENLKIREAEALARKNRIDEQDLMFFEKFVTTDLIGNNLRSGIMYFELGLSVTQNVLNKIREAGFTIKRVQTVFGTAYEVSF